MKLNQNRLESDDFHGQFIEHDPWGDTECGLFVGRIVFDEWLSEDENDVSVYHFNVDCLIDDFIEHYSRHDNGKLEGSGKEKAGFIIANLKTMIEKLEKRF